MFKENKWKILITSIVILCPIIAGLILWDKLPEQIAIHFNAQNQPDGWTNRSVAVFVLPLIVLALHLTAILATCLDKKNKNIAPAVFNVCLWICPTICLVASALTYTATLGYQMNIGFIILLFIGGLFVLIGNYLPKCKQNNTFGIRLPWTKKDSENWNKTHRVAGWTTTIAGLIVIATAFLTNPWLSLSVMIISIITPVIFSFGYHLKHK